MELHQELFEAWLFSQPKERIIESGAGDSCFLCSFVRETTNRKKAHFLGWSKWSETGRWNRPKKLPSWARKLIDREWIIKHTGGSPDMAISVGAMQARYRKLFPETITTNEKTRNELPASNPAPQDHQDPGTGQADGVGSVLAEMGVDH